MQKKKYEYKKRVTEVAREEFFDKGYKETSMRSISQKSKVGLSNIYNYFKNKDDILKEILSPLISELTLLLNEHNEPQHIDLRVFYSNQILDHNIQRYLHLVTKYKKELKLLLFDSQGSIYEDFKEDLIQLQTKIGLEYMEKMKEKYPNINTNISSFFIHNIGSWFVNTLAEIVSHELNPKEISEFFLDYIRFSTAGWEKIMNKSN